MPSPHLPYRIALLAPPNPSIHPALTRPSTTTTPHPPPLFQDALAIRLAVFIAEQGCSAEEEVDADDAASWHWVLYAREGESGAEKPAATVRLVPAATHEHGEGGTGGGGGEEGPERATEPDYGRSDGLWDGREGYARIGRLATLKEFRGRGFGRVLVQQVLEWAGGHAGEVGGGKEWRGLVLAHAQVGVVKWYEGLGWVRDAGMGVWWEEGIEHVGMWMRVDLKGA